MIGILYVFHGSQKKEKNQEAQRFIQQLQWKFPTEYVHQTAFLENHSDTIVEQAKKMIIQGVDRLVVVPMLLFAAKHALVDIPAALACVKQQFPTVKFVQTETFGKKRGCRNVLLERFQAAQLGASSDSLTGFLVAHGTRRTPEPQKIVTEIAQEIQQVVGFSIRATSLKGNEDYLAVIAQNSQLNQLAVIVPFFLFEGHITLNMKEDLVNTLPETSFIMTETLAFDARILTDVENIMKEAIECIQSC